MKYDCMTPEEYALWANQTRRNAKGSPCYDCPLEFHLAEKAAGRCDREWPATGRPRQYVMDWHERRAKAARNRAYRAALRAQVEAVRTLRSNARSWDNRRAGSSGESHRLSADARVSATTRGAGVVPSIEVVAR